MKVVKTLAAAFLATLCVFLGGWVLLNDLTDLRWLRSEETLNDLLVREFPKGTPRARVVLFAKKNSFEVLSSSESTGVFTRDGRRIGSGHLWLSLGSYRGLLGTTDVSAWFAFTDEARVEYIEVRKSTDSF